MRFLNDAFLFWRSLLVTKRRRRSLGKRNTIWFRPIRTLLDDGIPAMQITYLMIDVDSDKAYPIGALCKTKRDRLIFWPLLTTKLKSETEKEELIDHVTLEIASSRSHSTGYEKTEAWHSDREWKLTPVEKYPLKFWFANGVDWNTIRHEPVRAEVWVSTPKSDEARRKDELKNYASKIILKRLPIPTRPQAEAFLLSYLYLLEGDLGSAKLPDPLFPDLKNLVPDIGDQKVLFGGMAIAIGDTKLVWACGWINGSIPGTTIMVVNSQNSA